MIQGLKERIRQRTHASVAEVDHQDLWQRAALGVAMVSADNGHLDHALQAVRALVDSAPGAVLLDWQEERQ